MDVNLVVICDIYIPPPLISESTSKLPEFPAVQSFKINLPVPKSCRECPVTSTHVRYISESENENFAVICKGLQFSPISIPSHEQSGWNAGDRQEAFEITGGQSVVLPSSPTRRTHARTRRARNQSHPPARRPARPPAHPPAHAPARSRPRRTHRGLETPSILPAFSTHTSLS